MNRSTPRKRGGRRGVGKEMIPESRLRSLNDRPVRGDRQFVLYWMVSARRVGWNWALQHAAEEARRLDLPLVVFEPLRVGYRWASVRFH